VKVAGERTQALDYPAALVANPYLGVPRLPDGPVDLAALAGGAGPVEIEVGFARAEFVLGRAAARPDARLIGVETRLKWVGLGIEKARARGVENVRLYAGDARRLLSVLPAASVEAVWLHFPDPWWKKRHEKRRVLSASVVHDIARVLVGGGIAFLQTDVPERADEYRALFAAEPALAPAESDANPSGIPSHREKKCAAAGLPTYRLSLRRLAR
jgi:tRNA (guanine-N7-)-methyltransferase